MENKSMPADSDNPGGKKFITPETAAALMNYCSPPSYPVNIGCAFKDGGTGLYNFNATEIDGQCVLTVLKEIGYECLFVVPLPCFGVYPWDSSQALKSEFSWEAFQAGLGSNEHNCLCVHQYPGAGKECRVLFKELMIQEYAAAMPGEVMVSVATDATKAITAIMEKKS